MTIVCGTDFSSAARDACSAAAALAAGHGEPLVLVHAIQPLAVAPPAGAVLTAGVHDDVFSHAQEAIDAIASEIRRSGADVSTVVEAGEPDEVILRQAEARQARLIVAGSTGRRGVHWLLGSTADRLASRSPVPVLVTREKFPAAEWLERREPLRVVVASDLGPSAGPAVEWAAHLPEHGPCRFTVAHLSWPPEEYERLAIDGPMRLDRTHPLVEELLRRDLASAAKRLRGEGETAVVIESTLGRPADSLSLVADREDADLLVVGRGRSEEKQWWEASTSRAVVRRAKMSVVCVPEGAEEGELAVPEVRRILAATDLTRRGNAAVAYALSLARGGAAVRVVHVMDEVDETEEARRRAAIGELLAGAGGVETSIEIVTGESASRLIAAEGEKFDADLICAGSRGRTGLTSALFGSVSQELLLRSDRPVLLVQSAPRGT